MRPRKYFVLFNHSGIFAIVEGQAAARRLSDSYASFKTLLEAEEYAAWWTYDRDVRKERELAAVNARIAFRRKIDNLCQFWALDGREAQPLKKAITRHPYLFGDPIQLKRIVDRLGLLVPEDIFWNGLRSV